ncbi:rhotekin isoform X1 [Halictus rubicundus]|uniref:rhotekin isoform X1 n=1 Tax=Halictus rubicundus TaxID=77578 RepID=UPI00403655E8
MAPRRKSIGTIRGCFSDTLDKENNYLRSLSDYQARVRRRDSIRNCKNIADHDLERKIELEVKMKEGSSRLLAAARHPTQSLEAARALLISSKRMSIYTNELQHRSTDATTNTSISKTKGRLSISDLRFPLMWRDTDHFKNRGDHRRFAVFCLARVGTEIHDTTLVYPIDRGQTDISFPDTLLFNSVPAEFELTLEVYSHVLQEDLSIASTPKRIRRTIHSSISKTVGRKLVLSLRDEYNATKTGPQFHLVAYAKMSLNDTDGNIHTHDLALNNFDTGSFQSTVSFSFLSFWTVILSIHRYQMNFFKVSKFYLLETKANALPLFGHFCCRLAVQPDCIDKELAMGFLIINDQRCWARLHGFGIEAWKTKKLAEELQKPAIMISVDKDTLVRQSKSVNCQLRIINCVDGIRKRDTIEFYSKDDVQKCFEQLIHRIDEHSKWKHAAMNFQRIPSLENSCSNTNVGNSFAANRQQGSLYDEIPLIEPVHSESVSSMSVSKGMPKSKRHNFTGSASATLDSQTSAAMLNSHRKFFNTIHYR